MSLIPGQKDFTRLQQARSTRGSSFVIGRSFVNGRTRTARFLMRLGVTPNLLSLGGLCFTVGAAWCLWVGASQAWSMRPAGHWPMPFWAALWLYMAAACDMLDGAVARLGQLSTPLGAVLDSSLDRVSDMLIYTAIAAHFARIGNLTYCLLAVVAMCQSTLISYVKARAETLIPDCSVGYWLRGERFAAILIASFAAHIPAVLWQQAISPGLTVLRRLYWTYAVIGARDAGRPAPVAGVPAGWRRFVLAWRYPRGSLPYDLVTGANIAWIIAAPWAWPAMLGTSDPLRVICGG
ncbi:MAG: CDP-alcohol phosphatidyltransferase family protein [Phycisphaerae bacterium]